MSMMPLGFSAQRVKSTQPVILGNFTSEYVFDMMSESDEYISIKNSYMSVNMQIFQVNETASQTDQRLQPIVNANTRAAPSNLSIPYINPNPIANLWQTVTADIAGQTICNIQNVAPVNTLYRMLFESKNEQQTINSTNKLAVMSIKEQGCVPIWFSSMSDASLQDTYSDNPHVTAMIAGNTAKLSTRQLWAMDNQYGFNRYNEMEINGQIPCPLGYVDELIPPNTPISLRFQCNTNFATDIVNIAGTNFNALGANLWTIVPIQSGGTVPVTENVIYVGIRDITIWLARVRLPSPVSSAKLLGLKQFSSLLHAISSGNHDEFIVETKRNRRVSHICIAFTQPKNSSLKTTQTVFDAGFSMSAQTTGQPSTTENIIGGTTGVVTGSIEAPVYLNSPIINLSYLRIEFGGATMPQTPYTFNFNWTTNGIKSGKNNSYDVLRAYNDYLNATDAFRDRAGCMLSFEQWLVSPIFVFKSHQVPNADTSTALVSIDFTNSAGSNTAFNNSGLYNCLVMCLYDEAVQLTYDQFAHLTSVVVA